MCICRLRDSIKQVAAMRKTGKDRVTVLLRLLLFVVVNVAAKDVGGIAFLSQKEEYVKLIAVRAGLIDGNCTLLVDCQAECSRVVCYPLKEDLQADCVRVEKNSLCLPTASNGSCDSFMKLNFNRSYLTLPPPGTPDQLTPEAIRDICLQKSLDETFNRISTQSEFLYVYFGSASGVFRAFPGRERPEGKCKNFRLWRRPWFKNAVSVQKQLKILVDTGNSMGSPLPSNYPPGVGSTFLEVASNLILQQLRTVSPEDFVDVATFNSSGFYQMKKVQVSTKFDESEDSNELATLETGVAALANLSRSLPGQSNLTAAILNAVATFEDAPADTLKVIVIFTDGQFKPLDNATFPTARLSELRVKLIVYKFPVRNEAEVDPFLTTTTLPGVLCGVNGTFEVLDAVYAVDDPLYAIRSFYTFTARIQLAVANNTGTWSDWYMSFSQPVNGTTVTYPAFGSDGQFIGVAGIDIYPDYLPDDKKDLVYRALGTRTSMGNMPAPLEKINFTCSYQRAVRSEARRCDGASAPANHGTCNATGSSGLQQRVCCDGCIPTADSPPASKSEAKIIVLSTVIPTFFAAVLLASGGFLCYKRRTNPSDQADPTFSDE